MLKKIKALIEENRDNQKKIIQQLQELEWANIFHDSIRGKKYLEMLPINIGRWAGNYPFFYVLNRILNDMKPKSILEFGLGESTKFISAYLDNYLIDTKHIVIEQDENWKHIFLKNFKPSKHIQIIVCPIEKLSIKGFEINSYQGINQMITEKFDLYIIDGPYGSPHYSRYDIVTITANFDVQDEFIILLDDYNRKGEQETFEDLLQLFRKKNIKTYHQSYSGNKSVMVIATEKYKYITSL
jgi:hypothetical protein